LGWNLGAVAALERIVLPAGGGRAVGAFVAHAGADGAGGRQVLTSAAVGLLAGAGLEEVLPFLRRDAGLFQHLGRDAVLEFLEQAFAGPLLMAWIGLATTGTVVRRGFGSRRGVLVAATDARRLAAAVGILGILALVGVAFAASLRAGAVLGRILVVFRSLL